MSLPRFLSLLPLLAALLAPAAHARAEGRDELVIGVTQYPNTLHPSIDAMLAKTYVLGMARRPLTAYDKDWTLVCLLCTVLPTIENGLAVPETLPDGRHGVAITYTLRPGATWGDGIPVSAEDVLFTWQVGRDPRSGLADAEQYRRILKIDVKDPKTVVFHMDRLTFDYNSTGSFELLPAHLERAAFAEPAEYKTRTLYDTDSTNPGLYFGPYRIAEAVRGSHVVLVANPTWWGKPPAFKRIVVKVVENTSALEANLLSGAVDAIAGELGLSIDQAIAFEKRHRDQFDVTFKPGLVYEHLDINLANPILADKRVRQALMLGLDRQALTAQLFDGRQPVADGPVSPLDWVHAADVPQWRPDLERAGHLLDEAGWSAGSGGMRHDSHGQPLTVDLVSTAGNRSRELVEQVVQSQWKRLGVDVRLRNEPPRVLFGETAPHRKFPGMAMFAWYSSPENVPRTTLHSSEIPSAANNWSGQNYGGYANPEMDGLIDRIEVELDRGKRAALWRRLQLICADDLPALPLYWRADAFILPHWLKGVEPTGHEYLSTLWVENWRREE